LKRTSCLFVKPSSSRRLKRSKKLRLLTPNREAHLQALTRIGYYSDAEFNICAYELHFTAGDYDGRRSYDRTHLLGTDQRVSEEVRCHKAISAPKESRDAVRSYEAAAPVHAAWSLFRMHGPSPIPFFSNGNLTTPRKNDIGSSCRAGLGCRRGKVYLPVRIRIVAGAATTDLG